MRPGVWLAGVLLLVGCAQGVMRPVNRTPLPGGSGAAPTAGVLETQIHDLVNRRRSARGAAPLTWDPRVAEIAREHSRAMARGRAFGHDGFDARATAIERILPVRSMAENVAYDSRTGSNLAALVVDGWITSAGHRQNIEGDFNLTGIGAAESRDGVRYFTQIFVKTD